MDDLGHVFPPRDEWDILAYNTDEIVSGYREHTVDDPEPGGNRSPAYRWGWTNARKDASRRMDGFEAMRSNAIHMERMAN